MNEQALELLTLLAEISAVFLGFSIVASSIKKDGFDHVRLLGVVTCTTWIMVGVFTPMWLSNLELTEKLVIQISSFAVMLANGIGWLLQYSLPKMREVTTLSVTMIPTFIMEALIWVPLTLMILEVITPSFNWYTLSVLALFAQSLILILAMTVSPDGTSSEAPNKKKASDE